jgi:hypothetical protein
LSYILIYVSFVLYGFKQDGISCSCSIPVATGSFLWTLGDLDGGGGGGTFLLSSLFGNGKAFFSGTSILISLFVDSLLPTGAGFVCSFSSFAGD